MSDVFGGQFVFVMSFNHQPAPPLVAGSVRIPTFEQATPFWGLEE